MRGTARSSRRFLPDGSSLHNRLLLALPTVDYARVLTHLQMDTVVSGRTIHDQGSLVTDVYFPNAASIRSRIRCGTARWSMLGVHRPTVTVVMRDLRQAGLISTRYGHIRVRKRRKLEEASCECYEVIRARFRRLGL